LETWAVDGKLFPDACLLLPEKDDQLCLGRPASLLSGLCHSTPTQQDSFMVKEKSLQHCFLGP